MGADKGVHILDPSAEGSDGLATAKLLSAALKEMPYDLIIGGMRAVDEDKYQVGSAVAEYLNLPQITQVIKEEIADGKITCESVIEGGTVVTEASLPVLFTTQRGLNEPRYASLPGIMKAKKKPIEVKTAADLGVDAGEVGAANNKVRLVGLSYPPERTAVRMIEAETADDQAAELVKILREEIKVV
jgi:electron transfer flavoprotein beta subunit